MRDPIRTEGEKRCARCARPAAGICCSSHDKALCHQCYKRTHFVEVCDCAECLVGATPGPTP